MDAGKELWGMKPKQIPKIDIEINPKIIWPFITLKISSPIEIIAPTPAANPSKPSNQLKALVIPTIQTTEITKLKSNESSDKSKKLLDSKFPKLSILIPYSQVELDIKIWKINLFSGDKLKKSSDNPTKKNEIIAKKYRFRFNPK